jgi:hypothetical protein
MVDVHDRLMPALLTDNLERPHAVVPHVGEVHRLNQVADVGLFHF